MNDYEEDGPTLSVLAVALALIFVIILIAYTMACLKSGAEVMESRWSKRDAVAGCLNCGLKPEQVAVISMGGQVFHVCIDCVNGLQDATLSLIDEYDGYDDLDDT